MFSCVMRGKEPGRQGGGYFKKLLFKTKVMDCYLLEFPEGSEVPYHTDPVEGKRHYRINITLVKPETGGTVYYGGGEIFWLGPITLFRPDIYWHAMTKITSGRMLMLSIGWVL